MIELTHGSFVKQYPVIFDIRLKFATATLAFLLLTFLLAGSTDQVQTALPIQEEALPVYSEVPDDEIDYDEFINRIPLRKPASKSSWMGWTSGGKRLQAFG